MSAALTPAVYVCVVSNYNLPDLEACLARSPSDIVLVVSDPEPFEQAADRLEQQLLEALPGVTIHRPDLQPGALPLGGADAVECQAWVQGVLQPYLQRAELTGKPRYLNFTGGTKAMILALVLGLDWRALDYKADGRPQVQVVALHGGDSGKPSLSAEPPLAIEDVAPLTVAGLHNDHLEHIRPNPLFAHPDSLALAQAIWRAQAGQDPALTGLFDVLEQVWSIGRDTPEFHRERVSVALPDDLDTAALDAWLQGFAALQPGVLVRNGATLELPGNKRRKQQRDFIAWVNANWLEQLCHHWLLEAGLPPQAVALNLKTGADPTRSAGQREADLLIHHRSQTRLIEVKAGLPDGHSPAELESQVSSLGERFGKTRKALFVSPRLKQQLASRRRWENFHLRCQANQVALCDSRDALLHFAGLSHAG